MQNDDLKRLITMITASHDYVCFLLAQRNSAFKHVNVKRDINQQNFKIVDLHFVKSE